MFCYDSPEYVKDMGTPERYYAVNEDCKAGRIQAKNLQNKQKAIFLDRDGTINKYVGFLRNIDDFEFPEIELDDGSSYYGDERERTNNAYNLDIAHDVADNTDFWQMPVIKNDGLYKLRRALFS